MKYNLRTLISIIKSKHENIILERRLASDNYTEHKTFADAYDNAKKGSIIFLADKKIKLYI